MSTKTTMKEWAALPEAIREILSDESTVTTIEAIAMKQGLGEMEQGILVRISANLMKGKIAPPDYVKTIESELDVPREKAAYIAQEVNREIFSKVKDALKELHTKDGDRDIDPKLVTCLPEQTTPGEVPSGNSSTPHTSASPRNIMEEKLAGTFRIPTTESSMVPAPTPKLVVPPAPQRMTPAKASPPAEASRVDPYRELPI